jgi:hypothetical protein
MVEEETSEVHCCVAGHSGTNVIQGRCCVLGHSCANVSEENLNGWSCLSDSNVQLNCWVTVGSNSSHCWSQLLQKWDLES